MDLELVRHAKNYIEKMAKGINPITNEKINENDLINNVRIARCLFCVNDILREVIDNNGVVKRSTNKKNKFYLDREKINKYDFSDGDLSISKIVKKINDLKNDDSIANLKITSICKWLVENGFLKDVIENGKKKKVPTDIGLKLGIYVDRKIGYYGEYDIVMYRVSMQQFIIDNFDSLLNFINK